MKRTKTFIYEKEFINDTCPVCDDRLMVNTNCDPDDTDIDVYFNEGDSVYCSSCDFVSIISITDDGQSYVVQ